MLGSHNSLTYLPCRKWWMYLINWAAKCQNKSLIEQYIQGVRYFDIRIKCDKNIGKFILAHGIVEYKGDIDNDVLLVLNDLAAFTKENIYIRFVLEYNKSPNDCATKIISFTDYVTHAKEKYTNLIFHTAMNKWSEFSIITWYTMNIHHAYSSILGWKRFLWIPYWYAKFHNKRNKEVYSDIITDKNDRVLLLDFV